MAVEGVVGAILWAMSWLQFPGKSASISRVISHEFSPRFFRVDHATIGPRSGVDRALRIVADPWDQDSAISAAYPRSIAARSRRDRGSIAPRSQSSSMHPQSRPISPLFDGDPTHMNDPRGFNSGRRIAIVRSPFDEHPTLIASPRGVR